MKTVVNNLVWLALFLLMVGASVYPQIAGLSQAVIWVIVALIMTIAPLGIIGACFSETPYLVKLAGTRKGFARRLFGYIKMIATFSAVAYAGFTVAAIFYLLGAFGTMIAVGVARYRLTELE